MKCVHFAEGWQDGRARSYSPNGAIQLCPFSSGCLKAPEVKKNKQTDCFILHCNGFRAGPLVIMSTQFTSK